MDENQDRWGAKYLGKGCAGQVGSNLVNMHMLRRAALVGALPGVLAKDGQSGRRLTHHLDAVELAIRRLHLDDLSARQ
jgi:hypothetical protein